VIPVGWQLDHTTATQGDTIMVIAGAALLGGFAALHYWFPKISGRLLGEGLGKAALVPIIVGLYVYEAMAFLAGVKAQPVDIYKFFGSDGLDGYNLVASIAIFVMAVGIVIELANAAYSYGRGVLTGHDPWGAGTLEWFALSPPPVHNFDVVPDVRSSEPLYDIRRAIRDRTAAWRPPAPVEVMEPPAAETEREPVAGGESGGASGGAPVA
jgi:heme/copper-type cytochrome/quinol oxidase subunit 1